MILPAHNLRCYNYYELRCWLLCCEITHVARRARSVLRVFGSPDSCDAEICNSQVTILVKNQVFRLDISMDNVFVVNVL